MEKEYVIMKKLSNELMDKISEMTNIKKEEILKTKFRDIEIKQGIEPKKPRTYFQWEKGEKTGWQEKYKFLTEKEINKTSAKYEKRLKKYLSELQ